MITLNDTDVYRPAFRRYIPNPRTEIGQYWIVFCNVPTIPAGAFYYFDITQPATLITMGANVHSGKTLTIDFKNYTIDYANKADKTKNDVAEPYIANGRTRRFFQDIQAYTKWIRIAANRRYDPYYQTAQANPANPIPHLQGYLSTGRGKSRAMPLFDESLCLWFWHYTGVDYPQLPTYLGLPQNRRICLSPGSSVDVLQDEDKQNLLVTERNVTQQEKQGSYKLHTTAYLLRDGDYEAASIADSVSELLSANYLSNVSAYEAVLANNTTRQRKALQQLMPQTGESTVQVETKRPAPGGDERPAKRRRMPYKPEPGATAPLAAYIRYKVMKVEEDANGEVLQKYFDYIFEGQSECVDEYQLLNRPFRPRPIN